MLEKINSDAESLLFYPSWKLFPHLINFYSVNMHVVYVCIFRQNCVECYPVFLVTLWTCGMFFSEVTAAAGGLVYIIARQLYFNGYAKSTKKRLIISLIPH